MRPEHGPKRKRFTINGPVDLQYEGFDMRIYHKDVDDPGWPDITEVFGEGDFPECYGCQCKIPGSCESWEQGFKDGQTSSLADQNLLKDKVRNEVLDDLIIHYRGVIESGKGVTFHHPVDYQWMYGGVVDHLKSLRYGEVKK